MSGKRIAAVALSAITVVVLAVGCGARGVRPEASASATRIGPGMNGEGEVVNSKLIEAGYGRNVKGLGDWQGEITGKAAPDSVFSKLQIGMPLRQVTDLIGQPTDQGAYITGKAFIPFYFGSDRYRHEMVYKGHGRLIFAGGGVGNITAGNLVWIIHNRSEGGYR